MEVVGINYRNSVSVPQIKFGRKLKEDEKPEYEATMNKAFDYLGIQNRALIVHGSCFPEAKDGAKYFSNPMVPSVKNHYIGSPWNSSGFGNFAKMHGFNCIQLGPTGELCKGDNSPYRASINAKNPLFIDYGALTSNNYANILDKDDIEHVDIKAHESKENYDMSDFDEAKEVSNMLMHKAYTNFESKLQSGDINAKKLNTEYNTFKKDNGDWLEKYGVFHVLSNIHGSDNFFDWQNPVDKKLILNMNQGDPDSIERYNDIKNRSQDSINEYMFTQFITDKQEKEDKVNRGKDGIKYIGDLLVGFSYADEWAYKDAFMPGWKIGAPDGGPMNSPQIWNNPLPDPNKLFNDDGTLGITGNLLKKKVDKACDGAENLRIDNAMGLVDPFIYNSDSLNYVVAKDNDGVAHSIADRNSLVSGNLSDRKDVDSDGNYKKIISKIIIPTLLEHGIDPKQAVWENLGSQSDTFKDVFYNKEHLPGIVLATGDRMESAGYEDVKVGTDPATKKDIYKHEPKQAWSLIGSHDNPPTASYLKEKSWIYGNSGWEPAYLGGYLNPDPNKCAERDKFVKDIENNPKMRLKAKYAELMRGTKNIQLSFPDLFGINKVYNPQDGSADTWKLRLNKGYEDTYHKDLENNESTAMNMPEIVGIAVNAKAGMAVAKGEETEDEATNDVKNLEASLNKYSNILKEPEPEE